MVVLAWLVVDTMVLMTVVLLADSTVVITVVNRVGVNCE